jgi:hypothetical protein
MSDEHDAPRIVEDLDPDYDDPKEPYAFFGLAAYYAQCLEQSLILIIVALHAVNRKVTTRFTFDEAFARLEKQRLSDLIKQLQTIMTIDDALNDTLYALLTKRNYLMHHFFSDNSAKWFGETSRRAMIDELRDLAQAFQDGDRMVVSLYEPLWAKLGVTEEIVARELQKLKAEVSA